MILSLTKSKFLSRRNPDPDYLTALSVPDMALKAGTTYYWRARYYDDDHNDSQWSETFSFTVAASENDTNENGIPDDLENTSVDLDNDGTADMEQETIKTLNTVVGNGQMGISIKESDTVTAIEEINSIDPDKISKVSRPDVGPLGLFSFRVLVQAPGDMAGVTIYFSEPASDDASWYIFDTVNGWTDYSSYSVFSEDRMSVMVRLWDGGTEMPTVLPMVLLLIPAPWFCPLRLTVWLRTKQPVKVLTLHPLVQHPGRYDCGRRNHAGDVGSHQLFRKHPE